MAPAKILVVDDDPAIRNLILRYLKQQNYEIQSADCGKTALDVFADFNPDLVILDVNLPDTTGFQLCQEMQKRTGVFVLFLTSRTDQADMLRAYGLGADDYITKPFHLDVLAAKVAAILKRQRTIVPAEKQTLTFGQLFIDPVRREVTLNNETVALTALEFDLLYFLASNPNKVWRRAELLEQVWDYDRSDVGDMRVVDVHIGQIRRKIEPDTSQPSLIQTVRGVGYKFETPTPSLGKSLE